MNHLNIEIKAKCNNKNKIREILNSKNAVFKGTDHQIDTYFKINNGRMKLREGNIENYLIHYERENKKGPKQSKVILYKSNPNSSLKKLLKKALGILIIIDKEREIYFIDNVKFHIDTVKELGDFVEIEAIDEEGNITKEELLKQKNTNYSEIQNQRLLKQCNQYLELFNIKEEDLIPISYSDLLLKK